MGENWWSSPLGNTMELNCKKKRLRDF